MDDDDFWGSEFHDWHQAIEQIKPGSIVSIGGASTAPFSLRDFEKVLASHHHPKGYIPEFGIIRLRDGRYVYLHAEIGGCCVTCGWQCVHGTRARVSNCLMDLVLFALTSEERRLLNIVWSEL